MERRMGRVEKFILGLLVLVATSSALQIMELRNLPSNLKQEMKEIK